MSRLTNADYLQLHHSLRSLWLDHRSAFGLITNQQQRALHRFFLPAEELSDAELQQYRRDVSMQWPNLPHRAGRAVARLRCIADSADGGTTVKARDGRRLVVHAVLRPEPNVKQLIVVLAQVASLEADRWEAASHPAA